MIMIVDTLKKLRIDDAIRKVNRSLAKNIMSMNDAG